MGHYCWSCGRHRPNETFTGKGHGRHQCRECSRRPKEELAATRVLDFISGVLFRQSNISKGNRKTLTSHLTSRHSEIRAMAQLALDVAQVKPHKRKRYRYLKAKHPQLLARLHQIFPGEVYEEDSDECSESAWTIEPGDAEQDGDRCYPPGRRLGGIG